MQHLTLECDGPVGILTINRPESLNALNQEVLEELYHCLTHEIPKQKLGAVILTGAGEKAFIAGADIKAMQAMTHTEALQFSQFGQRVSLALEKAPFATIAAVNGFALGGGLEMALACDFIYACESAKLGLPEVSLGLIPGFGGTQRLSRAIGTRRAKEMIFSGKPVSAEEGYRLGIVSKVCAPGTLLSAASDTAKRILRNGFQAICQAKHAINQGESLGMTEALYLERNMFAVCFANDESKEGIAAFTEKRKPEFALA